MDRQGSFSQAEYAGKEKQTRRDKFLAEMEQVVPWARLVERLRPLYPKGERGRKPIGLERMLRLVISALLVMFGTARAQISTTGPDNISRISQWPGALHVATHAALAAVPTADYPNGVWRDDYATGNGAPPLFFIPQTGTCAANSMANNGGQCVNDAGGNSFKAQPPLTGEDIREFGADGTMNNDAMALTATFAMTTNPFIRIPVGSFALPCRTYYNALSAIKLIGDDEYDSIFQFASGCAFNGTDLFEWNGVGGGVVENLTIDLNTPATPTASYATLSARAYAGNLNGFTVQNVRLINGVAASIGAISVWLVNLAAAGGHSLTGAVIAHNYLSFAATATAQNLCIGETTVSNAGSITGTQILSNTCVNTGMQVDGSNQLVANNDISGFSFGAGIYGADSNTIPASCRNIQIKDNRIHDTAAGVDINNAAHLGLEIHCPYSVIDGNQAFNLGGPGIVSSGDYTTITNNLTYDNGKNGSGGAGGIGDQAGINIQVLQPGDSFSTGAGVVVGAGNNSFDDGPGTQKYGIIFGSSVTTTNPIRLTAGSKYSGVTQAIYVVNPGALNPD